MVDETMCSQPADASSEGPHGTASDLTAATTLPSIWRRDARSILLALAGGVAIGPPFLVFAYTLLGKDNVAPLYPWLFFLGGSAILVGPLALAVFDTWQTSRRIRHEKKKVEVQYDRAPTQ